MIIIFFLFFNYAFGFGWVPLLDLNTYNLKTPSEIQVYNKKLVVWKKDNNIIVQDNSCMHRGAPLSEGYIDSSTKNLRCSYHGWEFSPSGSVKNIPQVCNPDFICNRIQKTYSTHQSCNILWVCLNDFYSPFPSHISDNELFVCDDSFVIEVPYTMNILLENLFDPAHVPFAHHKLQSSRDLASSVNSSVRIANETTLQFFFEDRTLPNNEYRNGTMTFHAPSHYELNSIYPDTFIQKLHVYIVPVFPHKTRIFVQNQYSNNLKNNTFEKNAVFILNSLPRWFKHIITHTFFDSDTMLLYKQEKMLRQQNSLDNCTSTYFTPTTSDSSIRAFHVWKKKYPQPWSLSIPQHSHFPELSRKQVYDRFNDHTKNCNSCKTAYFNLNALQFLIPSSLALFSIHSHNTFGFFASWIFYFLFQELKSFFEYRNYVHNKL